MRVATFNANSIRSRFNVLAKWLQLHQPDILAVQETKVQDVDFPVSDFAQTGYKVVFRGQKKYNGVAILSKTEPTCKGEKNVDQQHRYQCYQQNLILEAQVLHGWIRSS